MAPVGTSGPLEKPEKPEEPSGLGKPIFDNITLENPGSFGFPVWVLQLLLLGHITELFDIRERLKPTGIYDEVTVKSVNTIQAYEGLTVDGVFGPKTLAALCKRLGIKPEDIVLGGWFKETGADLIF